MAHIEKIDYAMAHLRIPILRKSDGTFENLTEYITVELEKISEIPPKPAVKANNAYIKAKLDEMFYVPVPPSGPVENPDKDAAEKMRQLSNKFLSSEAGKKKKKIERAPSPEVSIRDNKPAIQFY
jgi:hypothetical protein